MSFNIQSILSSINKTNGVALNHQYIVMIDPEKIGGFNAPYSIDDLMLRCDAFEYPQRSTAEIDADYYGPTRHYGGQANFTPVTASIILSSDMRERDFMLQWQDLIVGNHRKNLNADQEKHQFDVGFFDDYKSDGIEIRQFDQTSTNEDDWTYRVQLIDTFPQLISPISTSWQGGEIMRMNVTFKFRYFKDEIRVNNQNYSQQQNSQLQSIFNDPTIRAAGRVIGSQALGSQIGGTAFF